MLSIKQLGRRGAVVALVAGLAVCGGGAAGAADADRVRTGFRISPVPLDLKGLDRGMVGLGSYIVNAQGGCSDCHTSPPYLDGGDPHAGEPARINKTGFLAGGQEFGPEIVSPNITPDTNGRPGGMTYKKFLAAIRHGKDPDDPKRLLQVMPWPVYGKMTDGDLRAIYEYLRAIPSRGKHEE